MNLYNEIDPAIQQIYIVDGVGLDSNFLLAVFLDKSLAEKYIEEYNIKFNDQGETGDFASRAHLRTVNISDQGKWIEYYQTFVCSDKEFYNSLNIDNFVLKLYDYLVNKDKVPISYVYINYQCEHDYDITYTSYISADDAEQMIYKIEKLILSGITNLPEQMKTLGFNYYDHENGNYYLSNGENLK